jgi:hypothetical protein
MIHVCKILQSAPLTPHCRTGRLFQGYDVSVPSKEGFSSNDVQVLQTCHNFNRFPNGSFSIPSMQVALVSPQSLSWPAQVLHHNTLADRAMLAS